VRRALLLSAAASVCAALAAACLDTQPCVSRGTSTTSTGSVTYVGQTSPDDGGPLTSLVGSVPASVTVDDFSSASSCSGNTVEFTVRTGGCVLWATSSDPDGSVASIEDGQTCGVPTAQGVATMQIDQGSLSWGSAPEGLTLSGSITAVGDAGALDGYLQWTFSGP